MLLTAVQQQGMLLELASDQLKADREVVLAAVRADGKALQLADSQLRKDPVVLRSAARRWWNFDWSILVPLNCDKSALLAAVELDWHAMEYAGELKADLEVLCAAVRQSPLAMRWASCTDDKDEMLQVVQIRGAALQFASERLRDDLDVALAAVQQDSGSLQFASERLRTHPELLAASRWRTLPLRWWKKGRMSLLSQHPWNAQRQGSLLPSPCWSRITMRCGKGWSFWSLKDPSILKILEVEVRVSGLSFWHEPIYDQFCKLLVNETTIFSCRVCL